MDPVDDQVQRAVNRASNTVFALSAASVAVLVFGLAAFTTMAEWEAPAMLLALAALIACVALLLGVAALVSVHNARLLLAWRHTAGPAPAPRAGD